jgi:Na+-transporting NADH:ubiquinone oxidoreductase subunit NqrE
VIVVVELEVTLLEAVLHRLTVLIYLTWLTFYVVLAAPLKLWDACLT